MPHPSSFERFDKKKISISNVLYQVGYGQDKGGFDIFKYSKMESSCFSWSRSKVETGQLGQVG